ANFLQRHRQRCMKGCEEKIKEKGPGEEIFRQRTGRPDRKEQKADGPRRKLHLAEIIPTKGESGYPCVEQEKEGKQKSRPSGQRGVAHKVAGREHRDKRQDGRRLEDPFILRVASFRHPINPDEEE